MSPDEPVVIVSGADSRYALPLAVMLRSSLERLDPRARVEAYLIDDALGPELRRRVEDSLTARATVHWVKGDRSAFCGLPVWRRMRVACYHKLTLACAVPDGVRKAIWLDSDVLVLNDLARLWETPLKGRHALAVPDPFVPTMASRLGVAAYRELGLPFDAPYFNTGVMVVDVARWRRDDIAARALDYLRRFRDRVYLLDQEGLNVALYGRWGTLDEGWNLSASVERLGRRTAGREAHVLHFSGSLKPWRYRSGSRHHGLYYEGVDLTAWKGWRPGRTLRGALAGIYEASRLRRVLHPLERRALALFADLTRTYFAPPGTRGAE